jgi:hypothetical protein
MKLTNQEINALANKITREVNDSSQAKYKLKEDKIKQEIINKVMRDIADVEQCLAPLSVTVNYAIESYPGIFFNSQDSSISQYSISRIAATILSKKESVSQEQVKEDLIVAMIDSDSTLETLIQTLKAKYETTY